MPLAKRRSGAVAPVPVNAPPSNSQMKARPEPLCSPNARIAPVPLVWSRGPSALYGPYSTAGSSLNVPSKSISAPFGSFLPPRLATSTLPSATIEVAKSSTIGSCPLRGCHLGPVADTADMTGVAQRHRGKARFLALLDPDLDGLRRDRLPVAELAVDHCQRRHIDHDFDGLIGNDRAHLLPPDINRHPDHAV